MATKRSSKSSSQSSTKSSSSRSSGAKSRSAAGRKTATKSSSRSTAHKTVRKTEQKKSAATKHSGNPSSTGHGKAKKQPAKQTSHCWPGYEPVAGKASGTKGSCKPKAHQTAAEKKSDGMAAAASKLRKAGGSKAKANHS